MFYSLNFLKSSATMWFYFCFCFKISKSDLVHKGYYVKEYNTVLNMCKQDPECNKQLVYLDNNRLDNSSANNLKILDMYYEIYWKTKRVCQHENEPCGNMWGYCCDFMVCQYLNDISDLSGKLNEKLGLCSNPNDTYSVP